MEDILSEESFHIQEILLAASCHDLDTLNNLIETCSFAECKVVDVQDPDTGFSPLHAAIAACEQDGSDAAGRNDAELNKEAATNGRETRERLLAGARQTVEFLLENGAIWNQLDKNDETPGCIACRLGLKELYGLMVDAGVRAEMLLNRLEGYERLGDDEENGESNSGEEIIDCEARQTPNNGQGPDGGGFNNSKFLSSVLSLTGDKLLDNEQNGVMMSWESGIMARSAAALLCKPDLCVLNIGFGMGIIDQHFQNHENRPAVHHIVEAHPDVLSHMKKEGWDHRAGVTIHEGKWQDVLPSLVAQGQMFDAVFFDTFAESYSDFRDFFTEQVIGLLDQDGRWSFFNGMGADRQINYDVYQKVVEMDLLEAGFDISWEKVELPPLKEEWEGVKRRYWDVGNYQLPLCRYLD